MIKDKYFDKCLFQPQETSLVLEIKKVVLSAVLSGILAPALKIVFSIEISGAAILLKP